MQGPISDGCAYLIVWRERRRLGPKAGISYEHADRCMASLVERYRVTIHPTGTSRDGAFAIIVVWRPVLLAPTRSPAT